MDVLWKQINDAIHRRDTQSAYELIPRFVKTQGSTPKAVYEASEFYRKISDYSAALRVLPKERISSTLLGDELKLQLQLARILNELGASQYALRMVSRLRKTARVKSKVEILEIFISNSKYLEAFELVRDSHLPQSEPWHQDWLLHFYKADALSGLKRPSQAIEIVDRIRERSSSSLIRAIATSAKAEYLTRSGEPKLALPFFLEAQKFFKTSDRTADRGLHLKWMGICLTMLRKDSEAKGCLSAAWDILYRLGAKPETWLEILLWTSRPSPWVSRLSAMMGPRYPLLVKNSITGAESENLIFSVSKIESRRKRRHFDRASDIAWSDKNPRLGLDRVDELVWTLIYAGRHGVPQYRLYEILWPDEPFSFDQHQKRLEQLVIRARSQGFLIEWENLHLILKSLDVSASGRPSQIIRGCSYLREYPRFSRSDVQKYFSLSRSAAANLCKDWLARGLIVSEPGFRYRTKRVTVQKI